jgi:DNA-binding MarR family transcriptional regulator
MPQFHARLPLAGRDDDRPAAPAEPAPTEPASAAPAAADGPQRGLLSRPRRPRRPFLHLPSLSVPSRHAVESAAWELLSAPVEAARYRMQNPRELSDRIAMGRAIWRDLVIGFAAQLGELRMGFTQLAAMYALADNGTMTVADLADELGRSPSTVSRLVDGLVARQLVERRQDAEDRRQRTVSLTGRGQALLGLVDRARVAEFLSIVRPLPTPERAVVAMGVAALSTHAISRRGHLIKQRAVAPRVSLASAARARPDGPPARPDGPPARPDEPEPGPGSALGRGDPGGALEGGQA